MVDAGTALTVVGTASSLGAAACGVKVVQAHREIVDGVGRALRNAWHETASEPVPPAILELVDRFDGGAELKQ